MKMRQFYYSRNHYEDEDFANRMSHEGWAATRLVEGIWEFEPCEPDQYFYRVCYLRGKGKAEIEAYKKELAEKGLELIFQYTFWGGVRGAKPFVLYSEEEEKELIKQILKPMILGTWLGWILTAVGIVLTLTVGRWFVILVLLAGMYAFIATRLTISYRKIQKEQC